MLHLLLLLAALPSLRGDPPDHHCDHLPDHHTLVCYCARYGMEVSSLPALLQDYPPPVESLVLQVRLST